jgi:thiamine kinase-like enzyme
MPFTVEEAVSHVPQWAGAKGLRITPLGGGITNNNYRIDVGDEAFVLRIPGTDTELLGINRDDEHAANLVAGKLGIAPEVYYFIKPEGCLVTRFIHGRPLPLEEITQPENIRRAMQVVRKIHSMPDIPGRFDVFQVIRDYSTTARRFSVDLPANYYELMIRIDEAENALKAQPRQLHPCHNDLLNANFLTDGHLYILDWEYAGMGDIFFDLANFSDHHDLSDEQDRWLLSCYFDKNATPEQWAHLKIMKIMSDLREASWGLVQMGISKLDFDYRAYTSKFYSRVIEQINNPHWNEWLKEVSIYD